MSIAFQNSCNRRKLQDAHDFLAFAQGKLQATVRQLFPVGHPIPWMHGAHVQGGHVVSHGYEDDLVVRNERTLRETKISSYQVLQAMKFLDGVSS